MDLIFVYVKEHLSKSSTTGLVHHRYHGVRRSVQVQSVKWLSHLMNPSPYNSIGAQSHIHPATQVVIINNNIENAVFNLFLAFWTKLLLCISQKAQY